MLIMMINDHTHVPWGVQMAQVFLVLVLGAKIFAVFHLK